MKLIKIEAKYLNAKLIYNNIVGLEMAKEIVIEAELLWSLYWGNQYSTYKMAKTFKCATSNIWYKLEKYNIPRRTKSEAFILAFNKYISEKARKKMAKTKKKKYANKELVMWNKGLTKETDRRIANYSGKNHLWWKGGAISLTCDFCGKIFERNRGEFKQNKQDGWKHFYCCRICQGNGAKIFGTQAGKNNGFWQGGYFPYYGDNWNNIRKNILLKRGGISELNGKEDIDVHHIYPVGVFVKKYIEQCLKPYINDIKVNSFKILPYDLIPQIIFDEANTEKNLIILTKQEHHKFERMPPTFFNAIRGDIN